MLEPPPEPPRPGLSPPEGDIASEPLPPLPGMPTLEPGCADTTIPELSLFPPAPLGGARTEPASPGAPSPEPFLPEPETPEPEPTEGGGGTILLARPVAIPLALPKRFPDAALEADPATDGGGGTTLELSEAWRDVPAAAEPFVPDPFTDGGGGTILVLVPREVWRDAPDAPPVALEADGGGGTMLAASAPLGPPETLRPTEETAGGGGTTSCVPKSFPIMLLTKDPLAA